MPIVVGITLRTAGKLYYFDPGTEKYLREERVLVETARGPEIGTIKLPPHPVSDDQIVPPLKGILRRATDADLRRDTLNRERETHALTVCKRLISKFNLPYAADRCPVYLRQLARAPPLPGGQSRRFPRTGARAGA